MKTVAVLGKFFCSFCLVLALVWSGPLSARSEATTNQLTVYGTTDAEWVAMVAQAFEKETGIHVAWVRESTGVVLQKLIAEKSQPQADVWFGGTFDGHAEAAKQGLLQAYVPAGRSDLLKQFQNPLHNDLATGLYGGVLGFSVNKEMLTKLGKPIPKTWDDLLNPTYKGLIAMANPSTSGTAFTVLATLVRLKGEEAAFSYMKKLHPQIAQYTKSGAAPGLLAGKGEIAIAVLFLHDSVLRRIDGYPLIEVVPQDGTGYEIGGLSLVKGAPNPVAAKKFMDWVLNPKVQALAANVGAYQLPSNAKTPLNANIISFDKLKLVDLEMDWVMSNRDRLIQRWSRDVFAAAK